MIKGGRKRGFQREGKNIKEHTNHDLDNVLRKVQVHYISFIIDISNCIINNIIGKEKGLSFKDIDYSFKKQINYTAFEELRKYKIKECFPKTCFQKV